MIERQDIKTAIDIVDQWDDPQVGHVVSILMQCGNEIATLRNKLKIAKEALASIAAYYPNSWACDEATKTLAKLEEES